MVRTTTFFFLLVSINSISQEYTDRIKNYVKSYKINCDHSSEKTFLIVQETIFKDFEKLQNLQPDKFEKIIFQLYLKYYDKGFISCNNAGYNLLAAKNRQFSLHSLLVDYVNSNLKFYQESPTEPSYHLGHILSHINKDKEFSKKWISRIYYKRIRRKELGIFSK